MMRWIAAMCILTAVVATSQDVKSHAVWRGVKAPLTAAEEELRIPTGFEAFEPTIRARLASREVIDEDIIDCNKVPEPSVPQQIPTWATATSEELRLQGIEELISEGTMRPLEVFIKGSEVVIKKCSSGAIASVAERTIPKESSDPHPTWDIYFACGDAAKTYTITVKSTMEFGKSGTTASGTYRLLAVDRNVILDGANKTRIMKVLRRANMTVYGLTLKRGLAGNNYATNLDNLPTSGWNGAAILVVDEGALTAYHCRFLRNKSEALFARWSGGAAVKLETGSYGLFWGCDFEENDAAVGGALATSSAVVLSVSHSRFLRNVARGGMDDNGDNRGDGKYDNPLKEKRVILARGGALRVDSGTGADVINDEHVLLCNTEFTANKVVFKNEDLVNKFGYAADDWFYVRGAGMAVTLWNWPGYMDETTDNQHFVSIKDCVFNDNQEAIEPEGDWLGRYVLEWMGAGHCKIEGCSFRNNKVNRAILKVDNSQRWRNTTTDYGNILKDVQFRNNGGDVYNVEFKYGQYASDCTFKSVDGVPDGRGDCRDILEGAADSGENLSVVEDDGYDDLNSIFATPNPSASPTATATPTVAPGFVKCENRKSFTKCEELMLEGACSQPSVADECRLTCGMCEVCVDFDSKTCADAARYGRCSNNMYAASCPLSCGNCNATPTPTPSPTPTVAPDFVVCKNIKGNNTCEDLQVKGKCSRPDVARDCSYACGMCSVCIDYNDDVCARVVQDGLCSTRAHAEKCPKSCGKCNATPTPTPSPTPTPVPSHQPCTNVLTNSECNALRTEGKCKKDRTVARDCALTCKMCPVCVDYHPDVCGKVAEDGNCSKSKWAAMCPQSCGLCDATPTPTPSPTPSPVPSFEPCGNVLSNGECDAHKANGRCARPDIARDCSLACDMCPVCIDYHPEVCAKVVLENKCSKNTWAGMCPQSCGKCNATPTPTPTPVPTPGPDFVGCKDIRGKNNCIDLKAKGKCGSPDIARDCALACEMCPVCEDFHVEYCTKAAASGVCSYADAKLCPSSCGKCNATPTPTPTPVPTPGPDFVGCKDIRGKNNCIDLKAKGKCSSPDIARDCALACEMCTVCEDFHVEYCTKAAASGVCSYADAKLCPSSCGKCNATPTPTPTPVPTPAADFVKCLNVKGNGTCEDLKAQGKCGKAWVLEGCPLTCGACAVCEDFHVEYCAKAVVSGVCSNEDATLCPSSCGKCGATPTPTTSPTPSPVPAFQPCGNVLSNGECDAHKANGRCARPDIARECSLACDMCPVCIDYHPEVCAKVVLENKCSKNTWAGMCPQSCGKCNATPTPTPTPVPTPGPDFVGCKDIRGKNNCIDLKAKGKCSRPDIARDCALACEMCPVCEDFHVEYCTKAAASGVCSYADAKLCPSSCGKCNATPTPTPTPVPTPAADFVKCLNVKGNGTCEDLKAQGKCGKAWVLEGCPLTCGACAVCEDFNEDVCRAVAEDGQCSNAKTASMCAKSCERCAAATATQAPTVAPTTSPSAAPSAAPTAAPTTAPTASPTLIQ